MTVAGVDVSAYQYPPAKPEPPDWPKVRASGIRFAIMRCVREGGTIDPDFASAVAGARAAGIVPGAYCFLDEGSGAAQGDRFVAAVKAAGGPAGILLALDIERGAGVVPGLADVRAFLARVRRAIPTQPVLIYGSPGVLGGRFDSLVEFGPAWRADWGANPAGAWAIVYKARGGDAAPAWVDNYTGWTRATLWQFSSSGSVPGIRGRVDLDVYRGSLEELRALAGIIPKPAPAPAPSPAELAAARAAGRLEGIAAEHAHQAATAKAIATLELAPALEA